jgi:anti-sigma regulatory factor (Ser/Thr protein kinase)
MTASADGKYIHDAFVYSTDEEMVAAAAPFLQEGIEQNESAVVVCADRNVELLSGALGSQVRIATLSQPEVYRRVPDAIIAYQRAIERELATGASRVRLVGEVAFGSSEATWSEWARFESLVNSALADYPVWNVCIYDARELPESVVDNAEKTHPNLLAGGNRMPSSRYVEPLEYLSQPVTWAEHPLQSGPAALDMTELADLSQLRQGLHEALVAGQLDPEVADDLVIAASEIATNGMVHGGPPVRVQLWASNGQAVCTVTDQGPGIDNPFAGYVPANGADFTRGGMGLWMARRLCDRVDLRRGPDGFTVRLEIG